jgi:hypothetical protein
LSGLSTVDTTIPRIPTDPLPETPKASVTTAIRLVTLRETAEADVDQDRDLMNAAEETVTVETVEVEEVDRGPAVMTVAVVVDLLIADMVDIAVRIEMTVIEVTEEGQDHQVVTDIRDVVVIATESLTVVIEVDHQEKEEIKTEEIAEADLPKKRTRAV